MENARTPVQNILVAVQEHLNRGSSSKYMESTTSDQISVMIAQWSETITRINKNSHRITNTLPLCMICHELLGDARP